MDGGRLEAVEAACPGHAFRLEADGGQVHIESVQDCTLKGTEAMVQGASVPFY